MFESAVRVNTFKMEAPDFAITPKPILTRRGTCLTAAQYHTENYSIIETILNFSTPKMPTVLKKLRIV